MSRLDGRLDRLERRALIGPGGRRVVVWTQARDGSDCFTSTQHPGETRTLAELESETPPIDITGGITRIIVHRT